MLKKILIPFFVISVAAVAANGCGSSSSPAKDGGAGAGTAGKGTAGAGGGTAGTGTAGAGTDAGTAGATVDAGTAGATADAGTAGATADAGTAGATVTDSGTDSTTDATEGGATTIAALELECPAKVSAANTATPFTAQDFCNLYASVCGTTTFVGALTPADCVATYEGWATKKIAADPTHAEQSCVSYHLCNATTMSTTVHCPHAAGETLCAPM
jgi:hypothetical protein